MNSLFGERSRFGAIDLVLYLLGVVGLAASLTFVFLGMRAVMDVGGFCAEGGPYEIQTPCPEGVPLLMIGGIFGLFLFGGLIAWKVMSGLLGQKEAEAGPKAPSDLVSKLERLAALRQSGDLTDEEFDAAKRALMSPGGGT